MSNNEKKKQHKSGEALYDLCRRLYPICRSITGDGVRATLRALQEIIPLRLHEVPSGQGAFDWEVPLEWNLREAFIENERGERILDTANHNLHVVSYSVPTNLTCSKDELDRHLHSLPQHPNWIPYRTAYYAQTWGFCLAHDQRMSLPEGNYRVIVDATLKPGSLTYGELYLPGSTSRDILISTHVCHPSLANDNLSGISVAAHLAKHFSNQPLRYGLRFIFVPATIGAIAWLAENEGDVSRIRDALVISGVGDRANFVYKKSRRGDGLFDRVFPRLFVSTESTVRPFSPYGYDERQYCSPGFDIAAGCLMRAPYGEYAEYHTSADDLDFIRAESLQASLDLCIEAIQEAQLDVNYVNTNPKCEPQLGRRGLYEAIGGESQSKAVQLAQLWMLSYSDGNHSVVDIGDLSGLDLATLTTAAERLESAGLLKAEGDYRPTNLRRGTGPASQCRHCAASLNHTLVDLGSSPLCNALLTDETLQAGESFYPLRVRVCNGCFLAQLDEFVTPEDIFTEYSYFSSFSDSFVASAKRFVDQSIERFALDEHSRVFEVASNDGYLLQHYLPYRVPVLGIEPALNVAAAARSKGITTISEFVGEETAKAIAAEHGTADLVIANNVLAHTPYLNDFVGGLATLAGGEGVVSVEFQHLMSMMERNEFDTIYHEHFSYLSLYAVERIFRSKGLRIFDVEEIDTHGGSLRVYATCARESHLGESRAVARLRELERDWGVTSLSTYSNFGARVEQIKRDLLQLLVGIRRNGGHIVGYGVPGKGNTLLNYCGIRTDFIDYMVDRNPYKQGKYTPGTRIPIYPPERIFETKPEYVLIMVWNLVDEVMEQMEAVREWGARFIVAIPDVRIVE